MWMKIAESSPWSSYLSAEYLEHFEDMGKLWKKYTWQFGFKALQR